MSDDADDSPTRDASRANGGRTTAAGEADGPEGVREWLHWARTVESGPVMVVREIVSSALLVVGVGLLLFALSGVWPPMVAVQSGSMQPHMSKGDLVFIVEEHRFAPGGGGIEGTGVVPYVNATDRGYRKFGGYGDVIIYQRPDPDTPPIIHRARFWVDEGENWYDRADEDYVRAGSCLELQNCPAPRSGFITKGDNPDTNKLYDQAQGLSPVVQPSMIKGKAMVRIPGLGWIRLKFAGLSHGTAAILGVSALGSRRAVAG